MTTTPTAPAIDVDETARKLGAGIARNVFARRGNFTEAQVTERELADLVTAGIVLAQHAGAASTRAAALRTKLCRTLRHTTVDEVACVTISVEDFGDVLGFLGRVAPALDPLTEPGPLEPEAVSR